MLQLHMQIELPAEQVAEFCRRWQIAELAVFGSVLREDFRADSDLDLLITPGRGAKWSAFDLVHMSAEFAGIARFRPQKAGDHGEAARCLSSDTREQLPAVPWQDYVGLRNIVIHQYDSVDLYSLWETLQHALPALVTAVEPFVPGP